MSNAIRALKKTATGLAGVARRRGGNYVGHLLGGGAWPRAAYRFGWGPQAPAILQAAFAAAGELAAERVKPVDLRRLGLLSEGASRAAGDVEPAQVEGLMHRAHASGITGVSRSFRHLVRGVDGRLAFGDLAGVRKHRLGSLHFLAARDADRRVFNREFGASAATQPSVREALQPGSAARVLAIDNPAGGGWELFHGQIVAPLVVGKRVLDLGSNDPALPVMLLRAGAREVVAVEFTTETAEFARLNARVLSWRDMRPYDIKVVAGDMRLFLTEDLGAFDIVTAFCSLSYLPEEDMGLIVSKAAKMDAVLILQANDGLDNLPARTLDLQRVMRANGYPQVEVHTPAGFTRPLLVGYTYQQMIAAARSRDCTPNVAAGGR